MVMAKKKAKKVSPLKAVSNILGRHKPGKEKKPKEADEKAKKPSKITAGKNPKQVLHDIYFSKKSQEKQDGLGQNLGADFELYQKEVDGRLSKIEADTGKKIQDISESITILKEILLELRKENDSLRQDRQFFMDKIKGGLNNQDNNWQPAEAEETNTKTSITEKSAAPAYEEHRSERKIQTSLDSLMDLIMQKGSIKMADAAKTLKMKEAQVEEWAHILEEHDLIEIHYPTMGKPVLKRK